MSATRPPTSFRPRRPPTFNIRFNDTWTAETMQAEIHNRLDQAARRKKYRPGKKSRSTMTSSGATGRAMSS